MAKKKKKSLVRTRQTRTITVIKPFEEEALRDQVSTLTKENAKLRTILGEMLVKERLND